MITCHPRYVAPVESSLLSGGTSNVMNVYYLNEVNLLNLDINKKNDFIIITFEVLPDSKDDSTGAT